MCAFGSERGARGATRIFIIQDWLWTGKTNVQESIIIIALLIIATSLHHPVIVSPLIRTSCPLYLSRKVRKDNVDIGESSLTIHISVVVSRATPPREQPASQIRRQVSSTSSNQAGSTMLSLFVLFLTDSHLESCTRKSLSSLTTG